MSDERRVMEAEWEWRGSSRDSLTDSLNGPSFSAISAAYGNVNRHANVYPDSRNNYEENENCCSCLACCKPKKAGYYEPQSSKYSLHYASIDFRPDLNEMNAKTESQDLEADNYRTRNIMGYLDTMPQLEPVYDQKFIRGIYNFNYTTLTNNKTDCTKEDEHLLQATPKPYKRSSNPTLLLQKSFDKQERPNDNDVPSDFSYIKSVQSDFMVEDKAFMQTYPVTSNEASSIQDLPFRSLYSAETVKYLDKATQTDIKGIETGLSWIAQEKSEEAYHPNEIPAFSSLRSLEPLLTTTQYDKSFNIPEKEDSKDEYLIWDEKQNEPEIEPYLNYVTIYKDDSKKEVIVNTSLRNISVEENVEKLYDPFFVSPIEGSLEEPVRPPHESKIKLTEIVPKKASLTKKIPKVALVKAKKSLEIDSFEWLSDKVNNVKGSHGTSFESLPAETFDTKNFVKRLKESDHLLTNFSEVEKQSQLSALQNEKKNETHSDSLRFSYSNSHKSSNLLEQEDAEMVKSRPKNIRQDYYQTFNDTSRISYSNSLKSSNVIEENADMVRNQPWDTRQDYYQKCNDTSRCSYSNSLKSNNVIEENADMVRNKPWNTRQDYYQTFNDPGRCNSEITVSFSDMDNPNDCYKQPKGKFVTRNDPCMADRQIPCHRNYVGSPYAYDGQVREKRKGEVSDPSNCDAISGTKVVFEDDLQYSMPKSHPMPPPMYTCPEPQPPPTKCSCLPKRPPPSNCPPPPKRPSSPDICPPPQPPPQRSPCLPKCLPPSNCACPPSNCACPPKCPPPPEPMRPQPLCLGKIGNNYIRNCYPPLCDNSHRRCYQCPDQKQIGNQNDCFRTYKNNCGGTPLNFVSKQPCEPLAKRFCSRDCRCSQSCCKDQCFNDCIPSCRSCLSATRYCKPVRNPKHCCQSNKETSDRTNCTDDISQIDNSYDFIMNTYDNILAWINKCSSKDVQTNPCSKQDFHSENFQRDDPCFKIEVSETPCGKEKIVINKL